jgi:pimeloyl-ACP methyl ester carboxylesterase
VEGLGRISILTRFMIKSCLFRQTNVRYSDAGKGPVIVLLHGFMESLEIWKEFSTVLSKSFRVICIDLPGFGETPSIGYVHTMELLAASVKAVLNQERLRRYVIIGHSMGGYVALAFADLFSDNVKGLGLFHSTALNDSTEKRLKRTMAINIVKKNTRHYIGVFFAPLFAPQNVKSHAGDIHVLEARAMNLSKKAIVNTLEGMKDRKRRDWILEMSPFPVLFIIGRHDTVIPFESVVKQTELPKRKSVLFLENAGHMGFLEEKELALKTLRKFARKCYLKNAFQP